MVAGTCAPDTLDFGLTTFTEEGVCEETYPTSKKVRVRNSDPDGPSCVVPVCRDPIDVFLGANNYDLPVTGLKLPSSCGYKVDDDGVTPVDPNIFDPTVFRFIVPTTGVFTFATCK